MKLLNNNGTAVIHNDIVNCVKFRLQFDEHEHKKVPFNLLNGDEVVASEP